MLRNGGYMVRAQHGTVENNFETGTTYSELGIVLGLEANMDTYANNYQVIPLSTYSNGYTVSGTQIGNLL